MHIYTYTYIHVHSYIASCLWDCGVSSGSDCIHMCMSRYRYVYIYRERELEREQNRASCLWDFWGFSFFILFKKSMPASVNWGGSFKRELQGAWG